MVKLLLLVMMTQYFGGLLFICSWFNSSQCSRAAFARSKVQLYIISYLGSTLNSRSAFIIITGDSYPMGYTIFIS